MRPYTALLLILTAKLAFGDEPGNGNAAFDLTQNGKPACSIVIAAQPSPSVRLAALELQSHIMKISGAEIPIHSETEQVEGRRILLGESAATRKLGLHSKDFKSQEYLIAFRLDTLILIGRDWEDTGANRMVEGRPTSAGDSIQELRHKVNYWQAIGVPERSGDPIELPGLYDDQGTCLATYDFLEEIACDRGNYPPPGTGNGIEWKKVAWERLGTVERMQELGSLILEAEKLAGTDAEKERVALWRKALWDWMVQGREQYLATPGPKTP